MDDNEISVFVMSAGVAMLFYQVYPSPAHQQLITRTVNVVCYCITELFFHILFHTGHSIHHYHVCTCS